MSHISRYLKHSLLYCVVCLAYYGSLLIMVDTGVAMFMLLLIVPIIVLVSSLIYAAKFGFTWYASLIVGLLWLPVILILNDTVLLYAFIYAVLSFVGQIIGSLIRKLNVTKNVV